MSRTVLVGDPPGVLAEWLRLRKALGQDRFDEVWEGDYHVAPTAHSSHGDVQGQLAALLRPVARELGLWLSGAVNIGSPEDYRVPDLVVLRDRAGAVFLPTAAVVVKVVSPGDESYRKLGFYFARGVDEVLMVEPSSRTVRWLRHAEDGFETATPGARCWVAARRH